MPQKPARRSGRHPDTEKYDEELTILPRDFAVDMSSQKKTLWLLPKASSPQRDGFAGRSPSDFRECLCDY